MSAIQHNSNSVSGAEMQYNTSMDIPGSANMPMQQFQLLQQQRAPSFNGAYGTFIAPHPSLMYATRDVAFYPSTLAASEYSLPYTVQPTEKPVPTSAAESPAKPEPAPPPAKAPRTTKKSDKAGSTYASRHQAAESRRRQRINDRLDTLRKVVPHRDRANTAAFLEEVISYVVGLKKRLAELEGVSEDNLSVPQVDVSNILNGTTNSGGNTTVLGNPAVPATATATSGAADGMHVGMVGGMQGQPMAVQGPVMTGMPLQEGVQQDDPAKAGMPARGMPAPALNANQVLVPVALMQHDQSQVGQQAYMLVNRDDFPMMAAGQQHLMGMPPTAEHSVQPKQQEEDGLMDVLVGAAVQVEGDADDNDNEGDTEDGDGTNSNKSLTTRSGRRRNPTRAF